MKRTFEEGLLNYKQKKDPKKNIISKKQECQKQLFADFLRISVLKIFCNICRKTPVLQSLFSKVAGLEGYNSIEKRPHTQVFSCEYWEIFKDTLFYRTPLVAASGIEAIFLVCDTYTTLKIYKIVWHKHSLMISSSVVSCHPGKYSCRILHEYLSGWGNLSGKIISIKRNC